MAMRRLVETDGSLSRLSSGLIVLVVDDVVVVAIDIFFRDRII